MRTRESQPRILVVEDRELDREMLTTILQHAQYLVQEAADGPQALALVRSEHPDLVISDLLLPGMDGYQLVRELRADPSIAGTGVIFYTAVFDEQEAQELARECGVSRVLLKPMDPEKILENVAEVLKNRGVQKVQPLPASFEQKHQQLLVDKLVDQVKALQRSEEALKQAHAELEWQVEERTAELKTAVGLLESEIALRQEAEEELQVVNEELRVANDELEARVKIRTTELEAANQELEAFSYSVAHDLKAPIRAIDGFSRMLTAEHAGKLDAEALRLLKVICTNTKVMAQLIDDLLGLSRLTRQPMRKTDTNLGDMANQVFERLKSQSPGRNLQLTVHDLPSAFGDHSLLYQVMMNILGNAIKYTSSRETAVIEMGGRTEENETIYYVKDNGIGFDERYAGNLFGPFQRLHGLEEYEGTGIGLAIVQRIIQKHGGRVWAEGKIDEGATFYFALPKNAGGRKIG